MKIILLLLSISPFLLKKANSWTDISQTKYGEWRPHYPSDDDDTKGFIYARGPGKCIDCVKGPAIFPVGPYKIRPSFPRHRRPAKQNRRISYRFPEAPDGQANQIPGSVIIEIDITTPKKHYSLYPNGPSSWLPHKPTLPYPSREIVIPAKPSSGSAFIIPVPCVEKPKKCPRKGPRNWNDPIVPDLGSLPYHLDSCECGVTDVPKMIVRGDYVDPPFKYPWMVAVQRRDGLTFCGGAILNNQYILTAAHCIAKGTSGFFDPSEIQVAFVTNEYLVSKGEDVTDIIIHPEYEYLNKDHDIALFKLKERIQCSEQRRPICLPTHGMEAHVGDKFVIAGWGSRVGGTQDVSPYLKETEITVVEFGKCSDQFRNLKENFHCLQGLDQSSPCHGDSGGPMFSKYGNRFYVFGVASMHNSHVCDPNDVFVYTKVPNYVDWINNEMHQ